jgi:hypothetical protein
VDTVVEPLSLRSCTPSRKQTSMRYILACDTTSKHAAGVFDRSLTDANRAATYCVDRVICRPMHRITYRYTYATDVSDLLRASKTGDYGLYKGELKEGFSPRSGTAVVRYVKLSACIAGTRAIRASPGVPLRLSVKLQ